MLNRIPAIAIAALLAAAPALADDAHHPPADALTPVQAQPQPQQPQPQAQPGMPMGGPGMMGQGMHGMGMGPGMGMMCPMMGGMGGQGMAQHIDGHVAFIKAELRITPQQEAAWKPFEDALRTAAGTMGQKMMGMPGSGTQSVGEVLEQRQRILTTRLENTRRIQAAWSKLEPALSQDQRARAQQVLGPRLMKM